MSKDEKEVSEMDKTIDSLSRKTNIKILRSQKYFDNKLKDFEKDYNNILNNDFKQFENKEKLINELLESRTSSSITDIFRARLKKI